MSYEHLKKAVVVGSKNQLRDLPSVRFENLENDGIRVLFIGNSITLHGKAPELGWHGDWGMAASAKENDYVQIYVPNDFTNISETKELKETKITFEVLYEDENLLAVYKPQGLLVVEDENESTNTLSNQVLVYLANKNEYSIETKGFTPAPVHRIDRNTSGIVLIAKNMLCYERGKMCLIAPFFGAVHPS